MASMMSHMERAGLTFHPGHESNLSIWRFLFFHHPISDYGFGHTVCFPSDDNVLPN